MDLAKKIANHHYEDLASISSRDLAHGNRAHGPSKTARALKRKLNKSARRKAETLAFNEQL